MGKARVYKKLIKLQQVGDFKHKITISKRGLVPPKHGEMESSQGLVLVATVWANMETTNGYHIFDGDKLFDGVDFNKDNKTIHQFTIRFRSDVLFQQIINYKGYNYRIMKVENSESTNRFMFLYCVMLGDDTAKVNK